MDDWSRTREASLSAQRALVHRGLLEPVQERDPEHAELWRACDVANLAEGAYGAVLDPRRLSSSELAGWHARLDGGRGRYSLPELDEEEEPRAGRRYWMLDAGGVRAGTIQIEVSRVGARTVGVHGLYTFPSHRSRGMATRTLTALAESVAAHGSGGIRLDTYWTWHRAVRFYLARGFWAVGWRHLIELALVSFLPAYEVAIDGPDAALRIQHEGRFEPLLRARRAGARLVLASTPLEATLRSGHSARPLLLVFAGMTLALHLATRGWPLVRSDACWRRRFLSADMGAPEGLAFKIALFEAVAREEGWLVETPRIPGLPYDTYAEA